MGTTEPTYEVQERIGGAYQWSDVDRTRDAAFIIARELDRPTRIIEHPANRIVGTGNGHGETCDWDAEQDTRATIAEAHESTRLRPKKEAINQNWSALTPFARNWLRAEYRHLVKADVHPIIARGNVNRTANMFLLVKAGI